MKRNQLIALVVAVVAAVLIISLPRTPYEAEVIEEVEGTSVLDAKVDEAVAIIQNGEGAPMQAIGMLLDVLKEDPNHEKSLTLVG